MFRFNYNYNLFCIKDIIEIKKISKLKKINILDFGCGAGTLKNSELKSSINKIILYDKNKSLIPVLKKKYPSSKIFIEFNIKNIFVKDINCIIFSSVLQYMSHHELNSILKKIIKTYKNKKLLIFINDHPVIKRYLEFFLFIVIDWKKLFYSIYLMFNKEYINTKYYEHNLLKNKLIINNFEIINFKGSKNSICGRKKYLLNLKK